MKKLIIITTIIAAIVIFGAVGLANLARKGPITKNDTVSDKRGMFFNDINNRITSFHGENGYGNDPVAIKMAKIFSAKITVIRNEMFSKGKESALSLTSGNFITYCHINNDTVIYLCHVPQLRKFDSEAKNSLNQYAWLLAKNTISEEINGFKGNVMVGLRGAIIYDKFMFGNMTNEIVQEYSSDEGKKIIEAILVKKTVNAQQGDAPEPATVDGSATQSSVAPAPGSATQSSIPPAR